MSDVPLELVTAGGSWPILTGPLQTDSFALKIVQNLAFAKSRSSAVAFIDGASWL